MQCTSSDLHVAIYASNSAVVSECAKNPNIINSYWRGCTPVSSSIYLKRYSILQILVDNGADVNLVSRNNKMEPPLFAACRLQDYSALNILLRAPNLDINQCDFFGRSALWAAARYCAVDIVELLLNRGANLNAFKCSKYHPINAAFQRNKRRAQAIIQLFIRQGSLLDEVCDESPLKWAVKHGDRETFCLLVTAGCKVNSKDENWLSYNNLPDDWRKDQRFCSWIDSLMRSPASLLNLTACLIRTLLTAKYNGLLPHHVKKLVLPETLSNLLLFQT